MHLTRRPLGLLLLAALGASAGLASIAGADDAPATDRPTEQAPEARRILILGGTGFLGPALVEAATARGHTVTLFNRGRTRPDLFPGLEKRRGDRDPDKDDGLTALEEGSWDAVIDTSGYFPRMVRSSAELLAPRVKQYVFISTLSVYDDNSVPGADESAALDTMEDPTVESFGERFENYGPGKALCEQAAEAAMPGRTTIIRPGFIVGPEDFSGRFNYWPLRVREGGRMLMPGRPDTPLQVIDVRDLAEWTVHCIENGTTGVFNATGPATTLTAEAAIKACAAATGGTPEIVWVPTEFLGEQGMRIGADVPIWLPDDGDSAGFHQRSNARAIAAGLRFRPLQETCSAIVEWYDALPEDQQKRFRAGMSAEREAELLEAWDTRDTTDPEASSAGSEDAASSDGGDGGDD